MEGTALTTSVKQKSLKKKRFRLSQPLTHSIRYLDTSTYDGGFGASSELGFTRGEGDFSGGEGGSYPGFDSVAGFQGYDYDSDVASLTQTDVMAEERTNFG